MATDKEYQALIDSLSGECERLHKENEELQALSQEPTDAISRDAVLSLFDKSTFASWDLTLLERKIKALPSVTQKSGKWIIRDDLSTVRYYQCSECNEIDLDISDYCPNCGAKMESEDRK